MMQTQNSGQVQPRMAGTGHNAPNVHNTISLLVTLDAGYLGPLSVMLSSVLHANPGVCLRVYLLHVAMEEEQLAPVRMLLGTAHTLIPIQVSPDDWSDAPVTARYPKEMYFRIFAARYLPQSEKRVLYLDPDVIVNGNLLDLYHLPMGDQLFAAASHVKGMIQKINELRLDMEEESPYINSGVMLMNLEQLRLQQNPDDVFAYMEEHKNKLLLPDQDIISGLYGRQIVPLDPYRYNMTERLFALRPGSQAWLDLDWVRQNATVIHYCGRNKPWKNGYVGQLDVFYQEAADRLASIRSHAQDEIVHTISKESCGENQ